MLGHPKEFRRIYMVSSAVFGVASVKFGWLGAISAALGLAVDLTEDNSILCEDELCTAVEKALKRTRESGLSHSKHKILEELSEIEITPNNLRELIKQTEAYQTQYCTELDAREIINVFESFFKEEVCKSQELSNLYILSTGTITLEKLGLINDIIFEDDKKIDNIQEKVSSIDTKIIAAEKICTKCLNSIAFILVSMAVFLGTGILMSQNYDKYMIGIVPVCYGISEFLVFFLGKEGYVFLSIREGIASKCNLKISEKIWKRIVTFIMPMLLTVSCFWIILGAVEIRNDNLLLSTLNLVLGNIVSILFKEAKFSNQENNGKIDSKNTVNRKL